MVEQRVEVVAHDAAWASWYEAERASLVEALGQAWEGGVLYDVEHIGSTAVAGLIAKPCIDIMARVHPLPPPEGRLAALVARGWEYLGEHGLPGRHYLRKGPHRFHLHLVSFDTGHWARHLALREWLRADAGARARYGALKARLVAEGGGDRGRYVEGKDALVKALEREALAWWPVALGFGPVERLGEELAGVRRGAWALASGWALDWALGAPSRVHDDVDVAVGVEDQAEVLGALAARGWMLHVVEEGGVYAPWRAGEAVAPPRHQVHARRGDGFLDVLLEPREVGAWVFRRDGRITLPLSDAVLEVRGVPCLAPELALLYKAGRPGAALRPKDVEDFERAQGLLDASARRWLREALALAHPGHAWIEALGPG